MKELFGSQPGRDNHGMLAVTFALPEESRGFARLLRHPGETGLASCRAVLGNLGSRELLLFHTGMGQARAYERLRRFLDGHPAVTGIISAGYAGGLDPALRAGTLFLARNYSAAPLLARAQAALGAAGVHTGRLATAGAVLETPRAKARFARETGAAAVDMETATIETLCRERGVPLLSLRVISDPANQQFAVPLPVCFDPIKESPRPLALLAYLLGHPSRVRGFLRFALTMDRVRAALTAGLVRLFEAMEGPV